MYTTDQARSQQVYISRGHERDGLGQASATMRCACSGCCRYVGQVCTYVYEYSICKATLILLHTYKTHVLQHTYMPSLNLYYIIYTIHTLAGLDLRPLLISEIQGKYILLYMYIYTNTYIYTYIYIYIYYYIYILLHIYWCIYIILTMYECI